MKVFGDKERILFVFAHPDDAEIMAGGTILKLVSEGKSVRIVKMTSGNKGSRSESYSEEQLREMRLNEDREALEVLGVKESESVNLDLGDGEVMNDQETIKKIVEEIRRFKPEIIVTHNPVEVIIKKSNGKYMVNHRDHRMTAMTVVDAVYPFSRDNLFFDELTKNGLVGYEVKEMLFVDGDDEDLVSIEITEVLDKRNKAILKHKSQISENKLEELNKVFLQEEDGKSFERFKHVVLG